MGKLHTQNGEIMTISMSISGLISLVILCATCIFLLAWSSSSAHCRTPACFELGWPMKTDSPFLLRPKPKKGKRVGSD